MPNRLEFDAVLPLLPNWTEFEGRQAIYREFVFPDFQEAFAFMTSVAIRAEMMNHHPEWYNCYNLLTVCLTTHDVDGLSNLDIEMAQYMDTLYKERVPHHS